MSSVREAGLENWFLADRRRAEEHGAISGGQLREYSMLDQERRLLDEETIDEDGCSTTTDASMLLDTLLPSCDRDHG